MHFTALLALLALAPAPAPASPLPPWEGKPFDADPAAMLSAAKSLVPPEKADVDILLDDIEVKFDEQGRREVVTRVVFRVLTPAGAAGWASLEAGWSPWYEERPALRARVIAPDGVARELDPATIETGPASEQGAETYSDRLMLRAPLPAMAAGALVEEEFVERQTSPFFAPGTTSIYWAGGLLPERHWRLTLDVPAALPFRHQLFGLSVKPVQSERAGRRRIVIDAGALAGVKRREPFLPPGPARTPRVAFTTGRSWAEVAKAYAALVDRQLEGADLSAQVKDLVGAERDPAAVASLLATWIRRNIRYTGVELGEAAITPRTPKEIEARRYGDCKDMSALLVAMLRAAKVPAQLALLAPWAADPPADLPGLGLFSHAIVHVPGKRELWLDPTDLFAPIGQLSPGQHGRLAMIAAPGTRALVRTPEPDARFNRSLTTREFTLAETGPGQAAERREVHGTLGSVLRERVRFNDAEKLRGLDEEYVKTVFLAEKLKGAEHSDPDDLTGPFRQRLEAEKGGRAQTEDDAATVAVYASSLFEYLPDLLRSGTTDEAEADGQPREEPLLLEEPYTAELRVRLVPPPGYLARPLPDRESKAVGAGRWTSEGTVEKDGSVTLAYRFELTRSRLTAAEVTQTRKAVAELTAAMPATFTFDHEGARAISAGQVRAGLDAYRKLAALHPGEALHRAQLSQALIELGLGGPARDEARKAVELEPGSVRAQRALGHALEYDLFGRHLRKGFDLEGAIAAYRKARALDPKDYLSRATLAILLEHDSNAERYGKGSHLAEAIEEYRALRKDLKRKEMDLNLLWALLKAERFQELREAAPGVETSQTRDMLWLTAIAASDGAAPAIVEAQRLIGDAPTRRRVLKDAAVRLLELRRYAEAVALSKESSRGSPDLTESQAFARLAGRAKRYETLSFSEETPGVVMKRMYVEALGPSGSDDRAAQLMTAHTLKREKTPNPGATLRKGIESGLARFRGVFTREAWLDLAIASVQDQRIEGDDRAGYRIEATPAGTARPTVWFVVKEAGRYRFLGAAALPSEVGHEALARADKGDLAGARKLLEWVRAEHARSPERGSPALQAFTQVWGKGDGDARAAAACLVATGDDADEAVPVLEAARGKAARPELRRGFDQAIFQVQLAATQWDAALKTAERLAAATEAPASPDQWKLVALARARRPDEVRKLAQARLEVSPDEPETLYWLMSAQAQLGDFKAATATGARLLEVDEATAGLCNNLAWYGLLAGPPFDEALARAEQATLLSRNRVASALDTQAALYAEVGRLDEARALLKKELELAADTEPQRHHWYLFGRILEGYGFVGEAKRAYAMVTPPEVPDRTDSYELAKRRLEALGPRAP